MAHKIKMETNIKLSSFILLILVIFSCKNATEKASEKIVPVIDSGGLIHKTVKNLNKSSISNGLWISTIDSLSTVEINGNHWIFKYVNIKTELDDQYEYLISEGVSDKQNALIEGRLILTNKSDTLKYGIYHISHANMTLVYLPRGNFHHYKKKK
ncbi:hypothetical protein [Maribacter sp. ACAM166]|uniref:hypothetical protein n=1 Tax=Maribacter sp. ACAM166 TaxID=2508996 RepID=UPI0010FDF0A3|nr:hypothetical protein [Maribacter sp. ACAM166]TLP81338.1 hypothetical protein ES765_04845 [Maribacter sp. ACAM166]